MSSKSHEKHKKKPSFTHIWIILTIVGLILLFIVYFRSKKKLTFKKIIKQILI